MELQRVPRIHLRGVLGSGKTTLAELLAKHTNLPLNLEPTEKYELLAQAYKDPINYRYRAQIEIFEALVAHQQQAGIVETTLEDSVFVFSKHYLCAQEYQEIEALYVRASYENAVSSPDITIFLEPDPELVFRRIQMRRRTMESGVTLETVKRLCSLLSQDREAHYLRKPHLVITNTLDPELTFYEIEAQIYSTFV